MEDSIGLVDSGNGGPVYRALVMCLVNHRVKTKCKPALLRMFSSLQGTQIATVLLEELNSLLMSNKFQVRMLLLILLFYFYLQTDVYINLG